MSIILATRILRSSIVDCGSRSLYLFGCAAGLRQVTRSASHQAWPMRLIRKTTPGLALGFGALTFVKHTFERFRASPFHFSDLWFISCTFTCSYTAWTFAIVLKFRLIFFCDFEYFNDFCGLLLLSVCNFVGVMICILVYVK
jgi:hypothetical protein